MNSKTATITIGDYFDTLRGLLRQCAHALHLVVIDTSPGNDPYNPAYRSISARDQSVSPWVLRWPGGSPGTGTSSYPLFKDGPTAAANGLLACTPRILMPQAIT